MKRIYLFISRNRKKWFIKLLHKIVCFLNNALENKNNDHRTNGEFWLMDQLSKNDTKIIFDVGANVGKWSLHAHEVFKSGNIYAFEPIPDTFKKLHTNVKGKNRIRAFELALSNDNGILTFNYNPNAILFSSIYDHYRGGETIAVEVQCMNGDTFCSENAINSIDFLKIDAEGSEHLILGGFKNMLKEKRIKVIQFEYGVFSIDSKFLLKDYYGLFSTYEYSVGKIYPNHIDFKPYHWTMENFIGPNYIAVSLMERELINSLK